jgi:hypothetical protein
MGKTPANKTGRTPTAKKSGAKVQGNHVMFDEEARTTSPTGGPVALARDKHSAKLGINPFPVSETHWIDASKIPDLFGNAREFAAAKKEAERKGEIDPDTGNIKGPYARSAIVAENTDTNATRMTKKIKLFKKHVERVEREKRARSKTGNGTGVIKKRRQTKKRK